MHRVCCLHRKIGVEGFEPPDGGTKNRCLTTWRHPSKASEKMIGLILFWINGKFLYLNRCSLHGLHRRTLRFFKKSLQLDPKNRYSPELKKPLLSYENLSPELRIHPFHQSRWSSRHSLWTLLPISSNGTLCPSDAPLFLKHRRD